MHPFLTDQVANARLADLHAEAERRRTIRNVSPDRGWRVWRRPRPGPPPGVVIELPRRSVELVAATDGTMRPVA
jgi:hypothetical protein